MKYEKISTVSVRWKIIIKVSIFLNQRVFKSSIFLKSFCCSTVAVLACTTQTNFIIYSEAADSNLYIRNGRLGFKLVY